MRFLYTVLAAALFLAVLGFAVKNTQPVMVEYYFDFHWSAPLIIVLFATFTLGTLVGLIVNLGHLIRQKREIRFLKKQIQQVQSAQPVPSRQNPA
jgi:uncharacterized integral membrane protein